MWMLSLHFEIISLDNYIAAIICFRDGRKSYKFINSTQSASMFAVAIL